MSKTFGQVVNKYDNILIARDFNIDISNEIDENTNFFLIGGYFQSEKPCDKTHMFLSP